MVKVFNTMFFVTQNNASCKITQKEKVLIENSLLENTALAEDLGRKLKPLRGFPSEG